MTKIGQKGVIKALFCFVLFIWLSSSLAWAQAKGYGVEVRARSSLHTSTQPGRIISVSVLITSYQPSLETFIEEIGLPEGWQPLMPPGRFSIPARGSVTRVVAFQIPPSAQAKDYEVVYSVKSRRDYGVYDEEIFTVSILAVEGMEIVLVKKPVAIIGGQHYEADLQLINKSNTTRTYFLHLPDRDERYPATITPTEVTLDPGKSADLKLKGRIFEGTTSRYHFVEVQAVATGDEGPISTSVIVDLDVIPRGGGAHFLKSRWGYPDKKEFGFYISQKIRSDLEVRLNMLQKERKAYGKKPDMEDTLWTVSAEYRPWAHTLLELEYGLCDTDRVEALDDDKAYRIYLRGRMNGNIPYSIARIRAGTDFWGYYHDYDYTSATIGYPFSDRLQGNVSWYQYKDNLNLRRLEGTTQTYEELLQVYFDYELANGWYFTVGYDSFSMEDRLLPAEYDYCEDSWWLRIGRTMDRYSYSFEARYADQEDHFGGESGSAWNYNVFISYQLTPDLYVSIYGGFGDNEVLAASYLMRASDNRGISLVWDVNPTLKLSFWYTRYSYERDYADNSEQYEFIAEQTFKNENILRFRIQRNDYRGDMETSYSVSYVIPIDIKLAKKKNVGVLQGLVYETVDGEKRGISQVVLKLEGETSVTDEKGMFLFPALLPGTYLLEVDRASVGNRVPDQRVPITVEIAGYGEITSMDIGITDGASLNGMVVLVDPDAGKESVSSIEGEKGYVVGDTLKQDGTLEAGGLQSVLVEMANGDEVHRRLTDSWGRFLFEGLRPGKWVLKIYDINIPSSYRLEKPEQTLEIAPGDNLILEAKVLPRKRTIRFIEEGRVVMKRGEK